MRIRDNFLPPQEYLLLKGELLIEFTGTLSQENFDEIIDIVEESPSQITTIRFESCVKFKSNRSKSRPTAFFKRLFNHPKVNRSLEKFIFGKQNYAVFTGKIPYFQKMPDGRMVQKKMEAPCYSVSIGTREMTGLLNELNAIPSLRFVQFGKVFDNEHYANAFSTFLSNCPQLTSAYFGHTDDLRDYSVLKAALVHPNLNSLDLPYTSSFSDGDRVCELFDELNSERAPVVSRVKFEKGYLWNFSQFYQEYMEKRAEEARRVEGNSTDRLGSGSASASAGSARSRGRVRSRESDSGTNPRATQRQRFGAAATAVLNLAGSEETKDSEPTKH